MLGSLGQRSVARSSMGQWCVQPTGAALWPASEQWPPCCTLAFFFGGEPPCGQEKPRSSASTFRNCRTLLSLSSVSCESTNFSPGFGRLYNANSSFNLSFSSHLKNLALCPNFLGCWTMSLQCPIAHLIASARPDAHWSGALLVEFSCGHFLNTPALSRALCG